MPRMSGRGTTSIDASDLQEIAAMGDRQLVPRAQHPVHDPPTVDPCAVGAPQVQDQDPVAIRGEPAMAPRDPGRVDPGVAPGLAPHQEEAAVEVDFLDPVEWHQLREHDIPPPESW